MSAYISLCPGCAEKMNRVRILHGANREFMGTCSQCMNKTVIKQYEIGLTYAEAERRRRKRLAEQKRNQTVSGERGRAERRGERGQKV